MPTSGYPSRQTQAVRKRVDKFVTAPMISRNTRPVSWVKAARKAFEVFPNGVQLGILRALTVASEGQKADIAKPMTGLGSGVYEIALRFKSDAYRVVYVVKLDDNVWVVSAFKKKSTTGIATPKREIDLVRARIKELRGQRR